jgi:predicted ATP-grasp superfamily ATP-dependent carboligase
MLRQVYLPQLRVAEGIGVSVSTTRGVQPKGNGIYAQRMSSRLCVWTATDIAFADEDETFDGAPVDIQQRAIDTCQAPCARGQVAQIGAPASKTLIVDHAVALESANRLALPQSPAGGTLISSKMIIPCETRRSGMQKVLVLDANQRSALAVIRSLGRRGMHIIAGDHVSTPIGGASRYAAATVQYASPAEHPVQFAEQIATLVRRLDVGLVIPATDLTTMLLVSQPEVIHPARLASPPAESYEALTDKRALVELAGTLDVAVPGTRVARNAVEIRDAAEEFGFPLVLKPARSRYLRADRIVTTSVRIINSASELAAASGALAWLEDMPCLVQQFIPGHGAGIFALWGPQGPIAWFAHKRLREKPPSGGVSVLSESVDVDTVMQSMAARLLAATRWRGVAMIEFRVTDAGVPYLMEVNGRFWGSLQLAIDSGIDFPWLLYQLVTELTQAPMPTYARGRRLRWLLGDVDNLILQLRSGEPGAGRNTRAAAHFLQTFLDPSCRQEVFRWSDPRPGLREARQWLGALRS